ncbi:hypothetical protein G6O69_17425 [Pseudenhygromyxa sp. WMMC2535]|uniref:hypothetical protein n=1 Tax=Pseudenhygromyxa sp. WMMC2535 TaxID=2712867 RepID=UPI0015544BA2|nr:hypothetical protein [Pseudenhygromyxa sp. WMMC2535]NVB39627.1 hypothetical protein [Pseudenhygromyxa sp. WMMC2535]
MTRTMNRTSMIRLGLSGLGAVGLACVEPCEEGACGELQTGLSSRGETDEGDLEDDSEAEDSGVESGPCHSTLECDSDQVCSMGECTEPDVLIDVEGADPDGIVEALELAGGGVTLIRVWPLLGWEGLLPYEGHSSAIVVSSEAKKIYIVGQPVGGALPRWSSSDGVLTISGAGNELSISRLKLIREGEGEGGGAVISVSSHASLFIEASAMYAEGEGWVAVKAASFAEMSAESSFFGADGDALVGVDDAVVNVAYSTVVGDGSLLQCSDGAYFSVVSSILVGGSDDVCIPPGDTAQNSTLELDDLAFFRDADSGDYHLSSSGIEKLIADVERHGDGPLTDIDGDPIQSPGYPGADQP